MEFRNSGRINSNRRYTVSGGGQTPPFTQSGNAYVSEYEFGSPSNEPMPAKMTKGGNNWKKEARQTAGGGSENVYVHKANKGGKNKARRYESFNDGMLGFTPISQANNTHLSNTSAFISHTTTGPVSAVASTKRNGFTNGKSGRQQKSHESNHQEFGHAAVVPRPKSNPGFTSASAPGKYNTATTVRGITVAVLGQAAARASPPNYAGPKFTDSPDASCLPMPPAHWLMEGGAKEQASNGSHHQVVAKSAPGSPQSCGAESVTKIKPGMRFTGTQFLELLNVKA